MKASLASFTTHTIFFPLPSNDLRAKKYKETIFARESLHVFSLLCYMFVVTLSAWTKPLKIQECHQRFKAQKQPQPIYVKIPSSVHKSR